jgi:anti-sigma-K factor RskA
MSKPVDIFDAEAARYDTWFDSPKGRVLFNNAEKRAVKTSLRSRRTSAWRKGIIAAVVAVAVVVLFTKFDVRALLREALDRTRGIGP